MRRVLGRRTFRWCARMRTNPQFLCGDGAGNDETAQANNGGRLPERPSVWIRILYRCWVDRAPYDEARYLLALQKRQAPLLKVAASLTSCVRDARPWKR